MFRDQLTDKEIKRIEKTTYFMLGVFLLYSIIGFINSLVDIIRNGL